MNMALVENVNVLETCMEAVTSKSKLLAFLIKDNATVNDQISDFQSNSGAESFQIFISGFQKYH